MSSDSQQQSDVDAESSDVSTCLARYPEDSKPFLGIIVDKLRLIDSTDTKLSLDCGNLRGFLEETSCESFQHILQLNL